MSLNQNKKSRIRVKILLWIDVFALTAWGLLILKYWLTSKLYLLLHPDYFWLAIAGAIGLLILAFFKAVQLLQKRRGETLPNVQHFTIFPPGFGSFLLLTTAILGLIITPRVFASQVALDRGVTDLIGATRSQPQAFRASVRPENRTLVDWVRTLNVYPEPDAYTGQTAKVQGFVIHPPDLGKEYLYIARFVLTCCAADAYPIGLPVKLNSEKRDKYKPDTWLEIEGKMITETINNKRQLTISATSLKTIPQPKNPYSY
ncbi:MAG: TIGR03943 family protein [Scytonema sp. PMC 1069.18]|nr:TIGR03943 family protein [Scytonema sp. PMC 1069.18]MEC4886277.1 TIGR03943 family protein [Scytonema sp. PMC 1070.18]